MRKKLEITEKELTRFAGYLRREEREASTIEAYLRAAMHGFCCFWRHFAPPASGSASCNTSPAAQNGVAEIALKGKIRTILLPTKLCRKLLTYAKKRNICHGQIFLTRNGNGLSRKFIWSEMKELCEGAQVARSKVFPHNLRGLFARTFYAACRDVVRLADGLGHSSIETTRIYLLATAKESARQLDRLNLLSGWA